MDPIRRLLPLFVVVSSLAVLAAAPRSQSTTHPARTELLVKFKTQATASTRSAALGRVHGHVRRHFAHFDIDHIDLPAAADPAAAAALLAADPAVQYAQPNFIRHITGATSSAGPNDPAWVSHTLWDLLKIGADQAWTAFPPSAHDVVVAVIDTGINYSHPDLAASMWTNPGEIPGNGIDDDGDGYVDDVHGIDLVHGDSDPMDDNGHGTHTAGTIGAQGNNGIGVVGVAWSPQLLACKFLDATGTGSDGDAIACLDYIVDLKVNHGINIRVANNSWGAPRDLTAAYPEALRDAIDSAGRAGIVSVFAAGNNASNNDSTPFDPASLGSPFEVSVAASDENDARASFSNYGATSVDLAAPGTNIYSTYLNGYATLNGTSMAAPHVAGTLALMASQNPAQTPGGLKAALLSSVDPVSGWSGATASGGRLNVLNALMASTERTAVSGPWSDGDIGAVGAAGAASSAGGTITVTGAGADVWGTSDAFQYVYQPLAGDGTIVARVSSVQSVANWTKAGVMIRGSQSPASAQAFMLVSWAKGVAFQRRTADGNSSVSTAGSMSTAPRWVRLVRVGNRITAAESADGATWTDVGSDTFTLPGAVLVGLAVSSHVAGTPATATFDNVTVTPTAVSTPAWSDADVGSVPFAGSSASPSAGVTSITGSGADVWGTVDQFHFRYRALTGDGTIVARVTGVQNVAAWVKAGVMVRETLDEGSAHAFMLVSAAKGLAFQRREAANGVTVNTAGSATAAPRWVKLTRAGNMFTASESSDGVTWTVVGTDTIPMGTNVFVGLAVTSHTTAASATCTFDNVGVS